MKHLEQLLNTYGQELARYYDDAIGSFSFKLPLLQLPLSVMGGLLAGLASYAFHDPAAIVVMIGLFMADWATSVVAHYRAGTINSSRISVVLLRMAMAMLLLSVAWWFAKANPGADGLLDYIGTSIPGVFYFVITSQLLLSIAENMARLGVLPKDFVAHLKKRLNWRKKP